MEPTTHRTLKTPVDEDNNGSAQSTAGHGISLPTSQAAVQKEGMRKSPQSRYLFDTNACALWSDFDEMRRNARKRNAEEFRKEYIYGNVIDGCISKELKSCIWHRDTFSWQDESSGTMWVGVHGADSICVVTKSGDLDKTRLCGSLNNRPIHRVFFNFRKSLIAEIEGLADLSSKLPRRFHQRIEKPFGVVSVIPDTNKNHKIRHHADSCIENGIENGEMKVIEFLQGKMNNDTVFTVNETIQTAISAFQLLFQKEFKADEIQVSVMDPEYKVYVFERKEDPSIERLNIRQIKEHLDVINKCALPCGKEKTEPCPEDSSSGSRELLEQKLDAIRKKYSKRGRLMMGGR